MQRFVPSGNTINRAYSSPTCSLEVWAKRSPMSAWTSQTVVQNLRFRLRWASGRVIKGNQSQINHIIESVIAYSDRWLAQDEIDQLDHAIAIPKGSDLQLSTLQLFDLYETLEQCSRELVILPDLVLEVRRITPNWLKIMAAAIALIGVTIGAVRLVSRDQPSLQIATTPNPLPPEIAPPTLGNRQEDAKRSPQALPASPAAKAPAPQPPAAAAKPVTPEIAPPLPQSEVIAPKSSMPESYGDRPMPAPPNLPIGAIRQEDSMSKPSAPQNISPSTLANGQAVDNANSPSVAIPEASDSLPNIASSRSARPSATLPSATLPDAKLRIANVQSQLPETVQTDLVKYISNYLDQQAVVLSRNYVIEMQVTGDRISEIVVIPAPTNKTDQNALQQLQQAIKLWRSANTANGSIRIEINLSK